MDHVVAPLDADHARLVTQLAAELAAAVGIEGTTVPPHPPHITLASYGGAGAGPVSAALADVVAGMVPLRVRAHGYGVFTGDQDSDLSLHVMVVRSRALDGLHAAVHAALGRVGACPAGITGPDVWTPHITLLDRDLSPARLGRAVEILARRPHRTWTVTIDRLVLAAPAAAGSAQRRA